MKLVLLSKKHVEALHGKWIVQLNIDEPDKVINEANWDFMAEKRISFVTNLRMVGLYYDHGDFKTWEEFAFKFNHYVEGDSKDTRFYRLLTDTEIDFLATKFKTKI
jgi:hypothetical protein